MILIWYSTIGFIIKQRNNSSICQNSVSLYHFAWLYDSNEVYDFGIEPSVKILRMYFFSFL